MINLCEYYKTNNLATMITLLTESLSKSLPFETVIVKIGLRMKLVLIAIRKVILKLSVCQELQQQNDQDG